MSCAVPGWMDRSLIGDSGVTPKGYVANSYYNICLKGTNPHFSRTREFSINFFYQYSHRELINERNKSGKWDVLIAI